MLLIKTQKTNMRHFLKILGIAVLLCFIVVFMCNVFIKLYAKDSIYTDIDFLPSNKIGLLLGTSKYRKDGSDNPFFYNRIAAAAQLYEAQKIEFIIASGAKTDGYNEPEKMRQELVKIGVPDSAIYADDFGFRTRDSILRCQKVFGQDSFTVISQKFHNERAIFIAKRYGINAIGYNAKAVKLTDSPKTRTRELFARVKAVLDLFLINDNYDLEMIYID